MIILRNNKVWRQFDRDCSGCIEADELKQFIKTLMQNSGKNSLTDEKLIEYADTIVNNIFIYFKITSCHLFCLATNF